MALRAYLLIKISDQINCDEAEKALRQVEALPEVDFADPTLGSYDLVLMVETGETVGAVADQIAKFPWVKSVDVLKIVSSFDRHRVAD